MKLSILPLYVIAVFAFCIFITRRAKKNRAIGAAEARAVYALLLAFIVWTLVSVVMGIKGIHASAALRERVPLLWQACVAVVMLAIALPLSRNLRSALRAMALDTPAHWLVFFEALRIGALGGVIKGVKGEVASDYVYWVGVPDFFFGLSAIVLGCLMLRKPIGDRFLMIWGLIGAAIILLPTFLFTSYFMSQPGFVFIFEFPMVLAPSIAVPIFILINFLLVWRTIERKREKNSEG